MLHIPSVMFTTSQPVKTRRVPHLCSDCWNMWLSILLLHSRRQLLATTLVLHNAIVNHLKHALHMAVACMSFPLYSCRLAQGLQCLHALSLCKSAFQCLSTHKLPCIQPKATCRGLRACQRQRTFSATMYMSELHAVHVSWHSFEWAAKLLSYRLNFLQMSWPLP